MLHSKKTSETIELHGERLTLLPEKAIYWESKKLLLIADLHLGKTAHFRNNGIAVPEKVSHKNWLLLRRLFDLYQPKRVCFLGDLFHSVYNKEWEAFSILLQDYSAIRFELILGNHDILPISNYKNLNLIVHDELLEGPFLFTHEPVEDEIEHYNIAGHIHPGVRLKGKGKQSHRVACFYFGETNALIPAFGAFTGLATISTKKTDQIFIVVGQQVIKV